MRFGPGVHFSASDVRDTEREKVLEGKKKEVRVRVYASVCVCVGVCACVLMMERKKKGIYREEGFILSY